jgi:hypothetical protein
MGQQQQQRGEMFGNREIRIGLRIASLLQIMQPEEGIVNKT